MDATKRRKRSTEVPAACLRTELFKELTARKGADTDPERARLLKLNPFTIRRLYEPGYEPSVGTALHIARKLGTKVDKLWVPPTELNDAGRVA